MADLDVESPCNGTCALDARTNLCIGCGRSLGEIAEWGAATPERQRQILRASAKRKAARGSRAPVTGASVTF